jgi:hypothetical protein
MIFLDVAFSLVDGYEHFKGIAVSIFYVEETLPSGRRRQHVPSETLVPIRDINGSSEISRCSKSVEEPREQQTCRKGNYYGVYSGIHSCVYCCSER